MQLTGYLTAMEQLGRVVLAPSLSHLRIGGCVYAGARISLPNLMSRHLSEVGHRIQRYQVGQDPDAKASPAFGFEATGRGEIRAAV